VTWAGEAGSHAGGERGKASGCWAARRRKGRWVGLGRTGKREREKEKEEVGRAQLEREGEKELRSNGFEFEFQMEDK
jgi:hypothetical protein